MARHERGRVSGRVEWTRSQSIRTAASLPLEIAILETQDLPVYQRISNKAVHLQRLGLSDSRIAAMLHVSDKTVAKAIAWQEKLNSPKIS